MHMTQSSVVIQLVSAQLLSSPIPVIHTFLLCDVASQTLAGDMIPV